MKKVKRFLSGIVAIGMMFSSVAVVSAEEVNMDQESNGSGSAEGYIDKDIFSIVVPANSLGFILDPQGLVKASKSETAHSAQYDYTDKDGNTLENGFVFFEHEKKVVSGKTTTTVKEKTNHIDIVVENKSSYNVSVKPTLVYTDGMDNGEKMNCTATTNMAANGTLKTNLLFNLYQKKPAASGTNAEYVSTVTRDKKGNAISNSYLLNGVPDMYKTTYSATDGYTYSLDDTNYNKLTEAQKIEKGNIITYTLEGFSNVNSTNWGTIVGKMGKTSTDENPVSQPSLKITWKIEKK